MQEVFDEIIYKLKEVPNEHRNQEYNEAISDVIDFIERFQKNYNNGWIPCSERLPNFEERKRSYCRNAHGAEFIVMIEGATLPTTLYIKMVDNNWRDEHGNYYNVIAWQPLPESYQPKGDNNEIK